MGTNQPKTIPQGYKATALGIIPQEWEVRPLNYLGAICSGGTPDTEVAEYWNGDIAWCTPSDITKLDTKYIESTEVKITAKGLKESSATLLPPRSIVVCTRATIGNAAICNTEIATNQGFKNIIPNEKTNPEWLYYIIIYSKPRLVRFGCGSTFLEVSKKDFSRFKIAVPPLAEQRKIAEVLGVWDEAIEKQARLIEKLALRKRALMQRLLSAKLRLPGFSEPWQKVKLGDIGDTYNGLSGKNKDDFEYGNAQFIPYINVFSNERIDTNNLGCVQIEPTEQQNTVKYGDIFFTVSSETPDEVGMASVLLEHLDNTYLNSFCFGYRLNNFSTLNPFFAAYLFRTEHFRNYMSVLAQGSTRFNISKKEVMKLKIDLPTIEEQTAIAEVLTAADREIELAKEKLDRLRRQKRGLMQQLLTGKKRIKY
jgi:type I restriction enzyme S subunit